jgi:hypothetical protein
MMLMLYAYFVYRTQEFLFSNFFCQKLLFSERFTFVNFGAFAAIFV